MKHVGFGHFCADKVKCVHFTIPLLFHHQPVLRRVQMKKIYRKTNPPGSGKDEGFLRSNKAHHISMQNTNEIFNQFSFLFSPKMKYMGKMQW